MGPDLVLGYVWWLCCLHTLMCKTFVWNHVKCKFCRSEVKLPGDPEVSGPWTTLWIVRVCSVHWKRCWVWRTKDLQDCSRKISPLFLSNLSHLDPLRFAQGRFLRKSTRSHYFLEDVKHASNQAASPCFAWFCSVTVTFLSWVVLRGEGRWAISQHSSTGAVPQYPYLPSAKPCSLSLL